MVIKLDKDYNVLTSTALLGYVGETNARTITIEGLKVEGADRYEMLIDYGYGTVYGVDITDGELTPTADILRAAQNVNCQIVAKQFAGDEYVLVKKSRMFRLWIGEAIGRATLPSPYVAMDALDKIETIGKQVEADVSRAENAASTAMKAADTLVSKSDIAEKAASRAEAAQTAAEKSATQAETAKQAAENARTQAVSAQNAAKQSADTALAAAQQTTADRAAVAGYAQQAKANADSTAADKSAVQSMAAQVTADTNTVAQNTAKVAADKAATETAADKAEAICKKIEKQAFKFLLNDDNSVSMVYDTDTNAETEE